MEKKEKKSKKIIKIVLLILISFILGGVTLYFGFKVYFINKYLKGPLEFNELNIEKVEVEDSDYFEYNGLKIRNDDFEIVGNDESVGLKSKEKDRKIVLIYSSDVEYGYMKDGPLNYKNINLLTSMLDIMEAYRILYSDLDVNTRKLTGNLDGYIRFVSYTLIEVQLDGGNGKYYSLDFLGYSLDEAKDLISTIEFE